MVVPSYVPARCTHVRPSEGCTDVAFTRYRSAEDAWLSRKNALPDADSPSSNPSREPCTAFFTRYCVATRSGRTQADTVIDPARSSASPSGTETKEDPFS